MTTNIAQQALELYDLDRSRLLDMLLYIQDKEGYVSPSSVHGLAMGLNISQTEVEKVVTFYHFLSLKPLGKHNIYLNNSVVSVLKGYDKVREAFEEEIGCKIGEKSADDLFGFYDTPCIGMSDQEPAAIIDGVVFNELTPYRAKEIVRDLKAGKDVYQMHVSTLGDGKNSHPLLKTAVRNNIKRSGPILNPDFDRGHAIRTKLTKMTPEEVLYEVRGSEVRGRGGAGFPTGLKWHFCRIAQGEKKYIFCNADEGEPGTFKDRVLLTETPHTVFEGMVIGAYAIGCQEGVLYLRYEYRYMRAFLENVLQEMRDENLLGENIGGIEGFNFDIRIQSGGRILRLWRRICINRIC